MAMTGMRSLTTELGWLEETPPDAIVNQRSIWPISKVPEEFLPLAKEMAHWTYGAAGGIAYVNMPERLRRHPWAGALYGVITWSAFELAVAPALRLSQAKRMRLLDRTALAVDHVLYGAIVAGSRWPQQV